jgi:hypothetical protein
MDDEQRRAYLGKLGRARVEQELAWSHQERAYLGVYQRLTGGVPADGAPADGAPAGGAPAGGAGTGS